MLYFLREQKRVARSMISPARSNRQINVDRPPAPSWCLAHQKQAATTTKTAISLPNKSTMSSNNNNNNDWWNHLPRSKYEGITDEQFGQLCEEKLAEKKLKAALAANNGQPVSVAAVPGVDPSRQRPTFRPMAVIPFDQEEIDKKDKKENKK